MLTNPQDLLETSLPLPIKYKHKNWFHFFIWSAIKIVGRHTNQSLHKVVKNF